MVAVALPPTLLQDMLRYLAFRRGQPAIAALLDGGWVLGSALAWPVVVRTESPSLAVACWGAGALLGLLVASPAVRPRLTSARSALEWWRRDARVLARPLLLDSILVAVSTQAVIFVIASAAGDNALGLLRAGQVYFAPLGLLMTAVGVLAVPWLAQRPEMVTWRLAARLSGALALVAGVVALITILAEPALRALLYAGLVSVPGNLLAALAAIVVVAAASSGFVVLAKVRHRGGIIVRSRATATVAGLLLVIPSTLTWGVQGAAWAMVAQMVIYAGHLLLSTLRAEARRDQTGSFGRADTVK